MSRVIAFSTSFGHALAPDAIVDALQRADADALFDAGLDGARLDEVLRLCEARGVRVAAVEAPCPRSAASAAMLASEDRAEADVALEAALTTIAWAGDAGAAHVVVRLGALRAMERDWSFARDRFVRGQLDEELAQRMALARERSGARAIDHARRALDRLARAADAAGASIALRHGRRLVDVPTARECDLLVDELRGAPLAPCLDFAAAHLLDVMGFAPLALSVAAFGERARLVYAGDACGPVGALAPGRGLVDARATLAACKHADVAFAAWSGLDADEAVEAARLVAAL